MVGPDQAVSLDDAIRAVTIDAARQIGQGDRLGSLEKDKEAYENVRANQNSSNPLQNCPRRLEADPNADVIWVALFCQDKIARIDTRTREITEIALPYKYSRPYGVAIDHDHRSPLRGEQLGDGLADAGAGAGHQGSFSIQ